MFHAKLLLDVQNSYEPGTERFFYLHTESGYSREKRLVNTFHIIIFFILFLTCIYKKETYQGRYQRPYS